MSFWLNNFDIVRSLLINGVTLGRNRIAVKLSPWLVRRRRESKRRNDLARQEWSPSDQPTWLTEDFYTKGIEPQLNRATLSQIATAIGVSTPYASDIRRGRRRPHPRHWLALAALVSVSGDE
jgi:hypothetical protein